MSTSGRTPLTRPRQLISTASRVSIRRKLLHWYNRHRRDLPWRRRAADPYAQWVAEIMLQQTRVETVIAYYERFLRRFPDLDQLAAADHEEVLKLWEGLGYYRRILHLHRAARLLHEHGEPIPTTAAELRKLPGIGEYTAAAIASIAFGRREAAVDGNVARVLSRLFGLGNGAPNALDKARIRDLATQLLPLRRAGDFNQAWMDLGSLICTPKSPQCPLCPLASSCATWRDGGNDASPLSKPARKKVVREVLLATAIFVCKGRMFIRRRPLGGLWSGLWEFPTTEVDAAQQTETPRAIARRLARADGIVFRGCPIDAGTFRHQLTHRSLTLTVHVCRVVQTGPEHGDSSHRWVDAAQFEKLSVSTAHRRVLETAQAVLKRIENGE